MVTTTKKYTAADLWQMPKDAPYELWRGELVYVPPSGFESTTDSVWFTLRVGFFVEQHDLGLVSGEAGGYVLFAGTDDETVVAPDVGFVRWDKLPDRKRTKSYFPVPPDFALEVSSPSDEPGDIRRKLALYMDAGVPLVWWVFPGKREVHVHRPGQPDRVLRPGDVLDGEDVLPGFRLAVADIFDR